MGKTAPQAVRAIFTSLTCFWIIGCSNASPQKLILSGGGEIPSEALAQFVNWSGQTKAKILVVTWATESPDSTFQGIQSCLSEHSPDSILHAVQHSEMDNLEDKFVEQVQNASGIFFSGGDQNKILDVLSNHPHLGPLLLSHYQQGTPFGGTSAGTAIMSSTTLTGNEDPAIRTGLGLLRNLVLDQHFVRRKRLNRLKAAMKRAKQTLGIGIDEDGAMAVSENRFATVLGEQKVIAVEATEDHLDHRITELQKGDEFDLLTRQVISSESHNQSSPAYKRRPDSDSRLLSNILADRSLQRTLE